MAGARSLAEVQLIIYWHKCKIRLALEGYLLAVSKLPTSWGCLISQLWLKLEVWPSCSIESTGTGWGGGVFGWMK